MGPGSKSTHGPSGHYVVPMGAQIPVLSPNDHPNPAQAQQKGSGKCENLKTLHVSLNYITTAIFGLLGGPWLGLHGPSSHHAGPRGFSSTRIVTK